MERPSGAAWQANQRALRTATRLGASPLDDVGSPLSPPGGLAGTAFPTHTDRAAEFTHQQSRGFSDTTATSDSGINSGKESPRKAAPSPVVPVLPLSTAAGGGANSGNGGQIGGRRRQNLYERSAAERDREDNYVAPHFMTELRTNTSLLELRYPDVLRYSLAILQQLAILAIFVVLFARVMAPPGTAAVAAHTTDDSEGLLTWLATQAGLDVGAGALLLLTVDAIVFFGGVGVYATLGTWVGPANPVGSKPPAGAKNATLPHVAGAASTSSGNGSASFDAEGPWAVLRAAVILGLALVLLSPVLHTMTKTYSDDTIWALSILLGFLHVVTADYDYLNCVHAATSKQQQRAASSGSGAHASSSLTAVSDAPFSPNLSMNAAVVGVVLLSSRVRTPAEAAALLTFGLLAFTLSPPVRHRIHLVSDEAHQGVTFTLCGVAFGCLLTVNPVAAGFFAALLATLAFAMPYGFVVVQSGRFKRQIQGPWDEARPQNSRAAAEWANAGLLT